jgi:hypothetical protein
LQFKAKDNAYLAVLAEVRANVTEDVFERLQQFIVEPPNHDVWALSTQSYDAWMMTHSHALTHARLQLLPFLVHGYYVHRLWRHCADDARRADLLLLLRIGLPEKRHNAAALRSR